MKQIFIHALLVLTLYGCNSAPVRIVDYENQPIKRISSQSISMNEVQIDVRMAVSRKGWNVNPGEIEGRLSATRRDGEASATVEVTYDLNRYSIKYKESSGLGFTGSCASKTSDNPAKSGKSCIKPTYNEWVEELNTALSGKLQY